MGDEHKPVLLEEVIEALQIRADGFYIDATFGRGGHSHAILERLDQHGRLLAFDKDPTAIKNAEQKYRDDSRFKIIQGSFSMLASYLNQQNEYAKVNGVLFDLGVSSPQLDDASRGFSFRFDSPLDMRMDPTSGEPVSSWLNRASEKEIADVIYEFGEEHASRRIARSILNERNDKPISSTQQLANIISNTIGNRHGYGKKNDIHPATKTFQALRIFINRELEDLKNVLPQLTSLMAEGGRLVVISFHSLEDRIVKRFIRDHSRPETLPKEVPYMPESSKTEFISVGKKIRASSNEVELNPRARSAIMRVAERCC